MFKQLTFFGMLTALLASSPTAWAIQERQSFDISVTIPVHEAYVLPSEPDWMGLDQLLPWDLVKAELGRLRKSFEVKNLAGGVAARLGNTPYLSDGNNRIDLRVLFNQVPLGLDATEVISADQARPGTRAQLDISAIKPEGGFRGGDYYGTVQIVFDFLAP